jgi:hypothetical protein
MKTIKTINSSSKPKSNPRNTPCKTEDDINCRWDAKKKR